MVLSCKHCQPDEAQIPFGWILDTVTGKSGATTDCILTAPGHCPTCKHQITEKTLVGGMNFGGFAAMQRHLSGLPTIVCHEHSKQPKG
jgi:hypothetical protein